MSEITKLYENVGIKKQYCGWLDIGDLDNNVQYVRCATKEEYDNYAALDSSDLVQTTPNEEYPPFTAEKVICLLEWEANRGIIDIKHSQKGYQLFTYIHTGNYGKSIIDAVASYFCVKWQDLTEEERKQIKEILE